jgi:hypothetical protein
MGTACARQTLALMIKNHLEELHDPNRRGVHIPASDQPGLLGLRRGPRFGVFGRTEDRGTI